MGVGVNIVWRSVPHYPEGVRIDLHAHSSVSDGTDSPAGLVAAAASTGLDVVALTDHDTTTGWEDAAAAAPRHGVALVRGSEISTRFAGVRAHLLSFLHDPTDAALADEMAATRRSSENRARAIVDMLAERYPITWADVLVHTGEETTVGRPHIADALVAAGAFGDRGEVFATVFAPGSPYRPHRHAPDTDHAIRLVRAAGGVPVLAHPGAVARGPVLSDEAIAALAEVGLMGLEVDHRDNPPAQRSRLAGLARELGLLVTGSSDYHGAGKPNRLGENLTSPEAFEAIEAAGTMEVVR